RVLNADLATDYRISERLLPARTRVTLDEHGNLLEYDERLERDTVLDGLPGAADVPIWRYADGQLSMIVLAAPCEVGGRSYPRGTQLFFDEFRDVIKSYTVDLDSGHRYQHRVFGVHEAAFT